MGDAEKTVTESIPGRVDEAENDKSSRRGSDGLFGSPAAGSAGGSCGRSGVLLQEVGDSSRPERSAKETSQKCKLDMFVKVHRPQTLTHRR